MKRIFSIGLLALLLLLPARPAQAEPVKGMQISPTSQFLSVDAGKAASDKFAVANLTDSPLDVTLSSQQFSVSNFTYDYHFSPPVQDWLRISIPGVTLQPGEHREIPYTVTAPSGSKPGGYYYTLFANATVSTSGVKSTLQATDLLYVTVNGALRHTSHLQSSSMPWISFGRSIPYSLTPVNTGNVHFFVYSTAHLRGWLTGATATPATHLLMPGKTRTIYGDTQAPIFPGIYRATYGYTTDSGTKVTRSHWVVFIPPWFIAILLGGILFAGKLFTRKERAHTKSEPKEKP